MTVFATWNFRFFPIDCLPWHDYELWKLLTVKTHICTGRHSHMGDGTLRTRPLCDENHQHTAPSCQGRHLYSIRVTMLVGTVYDKNLQKNITLNKAHYHVGARRFKTRCFKFNPRMISIERKEHWQILYQIQVTHIHTCQPSPRNPPGPKTVRWTQSFHWARLQWLQAVVQLRRLPRKYGCDRIRPENARIQWH